jgi:hypothetical protein
MHVQAEAVLRLFNDRKMNKRHRALFERTANELVRLAYACLIFVDAKWHLMACRFNFPMHLTMFNTLLDCMEQVCLVHMHACTIE